MARRNENPQTTGAEPLLNAASSHFSPCSCRACLPGGPNRPQDHPTSIPMPGTSTPRFSASLHPRRANPPACRVQPLRAQARQPTLAGVRPLFGSAIAPTPAQHPSQSSARGSTRTRAMEHDHGPGHKAFANGQQPLSAAVQNWLRSNTAAQPFSALPADKQNAPTDNRRGVLLLQRDGEGRFLHPQVHRR